MTQRRRRRCCCLSFFRFFFFISTHTLIIVATTIGSFRSISFPSSLSMPSSSALLTVVGFRFSLFFVPCIGAFDSSRIHRYLDRVEEELCLPHLLRRNCQDGLDACIMICECPRLVFLFRYRHARECRSHFKCFPSITSLLIVGSFAYVPPS